MTQGLTRRRTLTIMAAASAATALPVPVAQARQVWRGPVLGGDGSMIFDGIDRQVAERMAAMAIGEIDRLERIFSLFLPNSEISRLNRHGRLRQASHDLQVVLSAALDMYRRSQGAFNPAIQPMWQALHEHFVHGGHHNALSSSQLEALVDRCDPADIRFEGDTVTLRPGMAVTLNGVAQGYIADQVTGLFSRYGLRDTLVQLGETRALPGRAWRIGLHGTNQRIGLHDGAIATSAGRGTIFTRDGRWHHLIDPHTGRSPNDLASVTVQAPTALMADAASTAIAVAGRSGAAGIVRRLPQIGVILEHADGRLETISTYQRGNQ